MDHGAYMVTGDVRLDGKMRRAGDGPFSLPFEVVRPLLALGKLTPAADPVEAQTAGAPATKPKRRRRKA